MLVTRGSVWAKCLRISIRFLHQGVCRNYSRVCDESTCLRPQLLFRVLSNVIQGSGLIRSDPSHRTLAAPRIVDMNERQFHGLYQSGLGVGIVSMMLETSHRYLNHDDNPPRCSTCNTYTSVLFRRSPLVVPYHREPWEFLLDPSPGTLPYPPPRGQRVPWRIGIPFDSVCPLQHRKHASQVCSDHM